MEKISEIILRKHPQFNTVVSRCLVSDALYQMSCENVDYLIIMEDDKFLGIITDHDIASHILYENRPLNKIAVREFMSNTLPVANPETSLEQCMQLMERYQVKHLAIFDRFEFKGVISAHDLMHEALLQRQHAFDSDVLPRSGYPWNY